MATQIERVTVYRVCGRDFETLDKARDYLDGLVNIALTDALKVKGFTVTDCVKVTDAVLSLRATLCDLLGVILPDEEED
jgi:hypothetical protein